MGRDDDIGYGKPPERTRFRKGKSGNPKGRPKGSQNFATDLEDILSAKVTVTENGKPQKVSSQKAAMMRLRAKALKGDARSLDTMLVLAKEKFEEEAARSEERQLTAVEDEILDRYEADVLARAGVAPPEKADPEADDDS